jgi:hypothetical protein
VLQHSLRINKRVPVCFFFPIEINFSKARLVSMAQFFLISQAPSSEFGLTDFGEFD